MIISNHYVPDKLILRYCKIISMLEKEYSAHLEYARSQIHNEIFDYVKCYRSCYRREDRLFDIALNKMVSDLTYIE